MSRKTGHRVYLVGWRDDGIVKAGYTEYQRWQVFTYRGATLLGLASFKDGGEALEHERDMHRELALRFRPAFASREESLPYLGSGGGYMECYRVWDWTLLQALLQAFPEALPLGPAFRIPLAMHERTYGRTNERSSHL